MRTTRLRCFSCLLLIATMTALSVAQDGPPKQLRGHTAAVNAAVYTPDQQHVITVGADQTIRIWKTATGEELRALTGHTGPVLSVASSPDSLSLVSAAGDNTLRIWDVPRADPLRVFAPSESVVHDVTVSTNGRWAISFSDDKLGRAWKLDDGTVALLLKGMTQTPKVTAARADGNQIASGDAMGGVWTWETLEGGLEGRIAAHAGAVQALQYHPNNQQIISAGDDGIVKVWQLPFATPRDLAGHTTPIRSAAVTQDGQFAITGSETNVLVHQLSNGASVRELMGAVGSSDTLAVSPNNALAAAAGQDGVVQFWNLADGADRLQIAGHDKPITNVVFHPDNARIATAGADGTIRLWRLPVAPVALAGHEADVVAVDVGRDGSTAATASADKSVRLWNPSTGAALRTLSGHAEIVKDVAIRGDNGQVASGDAAGEVRLWNLADGALQATLGAHGAPLEALSYAANGQRLATVGQDGLLKIWQLPPPAPVAYAGNAQPVTAIAMTSDRKLVVTGGADKSIRIYDAANGQQARTLADVPESVASLAVSPDDQWVAGGTTNGVVKLWKIADGAPFMGLAPPAEGAMPAPSVLLGHDTSVVAVALDMETKQVVSAGADGTVRVWRLPEAPVRVADNAGAAARFVVSSDGKRSATAGTFEGKPAILIRDLVANGRIVERLLGNQADVTALAFQKDGGQLISGSAQGECTVWNLKESKFPVVQNVKLAAAISAVALSDDGKQLFASVGNAIHHHQVSDGAEVRVLSGHGAAVSSLVAAGPKLFSAAADSTVRGWTIATGAAAGQMNHGAAVTDLSLSPDGKQLASCGADKAIKIWNTADGAAVGALTGHAGDLVAARFSSNGSKIVSVAADGLWIWDLASKRRLETTLLAPAEPKGVGFTGDRIAVGAADGALQFHSPQLQLWIDAHPGGVFAASLTADRKRLVTSGADKTIKLWDLADGKPLATLAGAADGVSSVAITADGKQVVAGGADKTLRVWQTPAAAAAQPVPPAQQWELPSPILHLDLASTPGLAAVAGEDKIVRIWDLRLGRERERHAARAAAVSALAISALGQHVLVGGADNSADAHASALSHIASLAEKAVEDNLDVAFHPEGQQVFVAGIGNTLDAWKLGDGGVVEKSQSLPANPAAATGWTAARQVSISLTADGKQLASLDAAGRANLWSLAEGKLTYTLAAEAAQEAAAPPAAVANGRIFFTGDQSMLAIAHGAAVRLHAADTGRLLERWREPSTVAGVATTPDGARLLIGRVGNADNAALRQFSLERLMEAHEGAVRSIAFSADGAALVSGGDDKSVRLWNTADGVVQTTYGGCEAGVASVAVTRDGARIVAAAGAKVHIWPRTPPATEGRKPTDPVEPNLTVTSPAPVRSLSVSPDNLKLAAASEDNVLRVLDLAEGYELERFEGRESPASAVAFGADNKTILSVSEKMARVDSLSLVRAFRASETAIADLALNAAGAQAVTAASEGVKQWNLATGAMVREFQRPAPTPPKKPEGEAEDTEPKPPVAFRLLATRPDNAQIAAVDQDHRLVIWNAANGQLVAETPLPGAARRLRFSPDNQKLLAVGEDDHLRFYNPADGELTYELTSDKPLAGAAFSTDSRTVFTAGEELREWRYASPTAVRTLTGHGGPVLGVAYSPTGRWIASASADQTVRIWDASTGVQAKQLSGHQGAAYSIAFSPDESLLVSCGAEKGLRVWDVLGGRQLKQISVGEDSLYSVTFLADGKRIAAAGLERKIYIVNLLTGELQTTIDKHQDYLYRVALNSNGSRLLSCGYGGNILLWNTANNQLMHEANIGSVANFADFAPDGQRIVVASDDGKAYFVDIPANAK